MRKSKKVLVMLMSVIMLITGGLFTGCGCENEDAEINVMLLVNNQQDAFYKKYFEELSVEKSIKINYQGYAHQDYGGQLKAAMQDTPPDIFYFTPGEMKMYVKDGILADFSEYLQSEDFMAVVDTEKLYENVLNIYRYDGIDVSVDDDTAPIYGINQGSSYSGLGYNRTLVERKIDEIYEAGLCLPWELGEDDNNVSYTFEEFSLLLSIVKDETGGGLNGKSKITGMSLPEDIMPLVWSKGGEVLSGNKVTINNSKFTYVLEWLKTNYDAGNISDAVSWGEWSANQIVFFPEVGSWEVSGYVESGMDFDMMPWPTEKGDDKWFGQIGTAAYGVYSESPFKDVAMEIAAGFLKEQVQEDMVKEGLSLPIYVDMAESGYLEDDETYKPLHRSIFIDVISGKNGKLSPVNNTFNSEWYDDFKTAAKEFMHSNATASEFLATKQARVQELFDLQRERSAN